MYAPAGSSPPPAAGLPWNASCRAPQPGNRPCAHAEFSSDFCPRLGGARSGLRRQQGSASYGSSRKRAARWFRTKIHRPDIATAALSSRSSVFETVVKGLIPDSSFALFLFPCFRIVSETGISSIDLVKELVPLVVLNRFVKNGLHRFSFLLATPPFFHGRRCESNRAPRSRGKGLSHTGANMQNKPASVRNQPGTSGRSREVTAPFVLHFGRLAYFS